MSQRKLFTTAQVRVTDLTHQDVILHDGQWCLVYEVINGDEVGTEVATRDFRALGFTLDEEDIDTRDTFLRIAQDQIRDEPGSYADKHILELNPYALYTIQVEAP